MSGMSLSEIAICRRYIQSKFKSKIVETLAQGNNCSKDEIIEILKKHGLSYPPVPGKKTDAEMKAIEDINNDPDPMFKPALSLKDINISDNSNDVERKDKARATIKKQIKNSLSEEYIAKTEITMYDEKELKDDSNSRIPESVRSIVIARALQLESEIADYKKKIEPLEKEWKELNEFLQYGRIVKDEITS